MKRPSLEDLPIELLTQCFDQVKIAGGIGEIGDMRSLRLTSKRFHHASSPLLLDSVRVYLTSRSLTRLDDISKHPVFSKSVQNVHFSLCYYDAKMANDRAFFARCCASSLCRTTECYERGAFFASDDDNDGSMEDIGKGYRVYDEWQILAKGEYDADLPNDAQKILLRAHDEYRRLFDDQESVKVDDSHIERIERALSRFPAVRSVTIDDQTHGNTDGAEDGGDDLWFSDQALQQQCLQRSMWKGPFNNIGASPPVDMIPKIFKALSNSRVRPTSFRINFYAPNDLRVFNFAPDELRQVSLVLQNAKHLTFDVQSWMRQDSLAVNNDRPHDEILHLGALTTAFFDTPSLQTLRLRFHNYPCFHEIPQISLCDLLPRRQWPQLHHISLDCIPMRVQELARLLDGKEDTIRSMSLKSCYLHDGLWAEILDVLRRLNVLENINLKYPYGREFKDSRAIYSKDYPEDQIGLYVLGRDLPNPLLNFKPSER